MIKKIFVFTFTVVFCFCVSSAQDKSIDLDEVVITGTRSEVNRNNFPMTISVIDRSEIEESSESALLPVLSERIPGMFVTERGITGFGVSSGGSGGITMRGVGGAPTTGVLILIDGHPQYMGIMGHHLPDAYVASDVERVEVIRGPASILYGSNAMGGVINIITRRQDYDGWNANARLMYSSYNTQKYMANAGYKKGNYDGFVSINHDRTDGHRDNSDFHITNAYVRSGYNFSGNIRLWGDISIASYESQNPGETDAPMIDNIADILRGVASATLENRFAGSNGALKLFYNFGRHKINDGYIKDSGTPREFLFRSNDYNFGVQLYQVFKPFTGNTLTGGVDFKSYGGHAWNDSIGNKPNQDWVDKSVYELAGYLIIQQTLFEKLTLNAGLRLDYNENFGSEWVPQVGLAYHPWENTVFKSSVSKGFRSPTLRELYYQAGWAGANPDLKPERMMNYEISAGQGFLDNRLHAELTAFLADGSNIIELHRADGKNINRNSGSFLNRGIEFSMKWQALQKLRFDANYSYLDMQKTLLYSPKQKVFISGSYHINEWDFSAGYQFINNMYSETGEESRKENYGLLNAKISYKPVKYLQIFAKGENLTARKYEIIYGYPMPKFTIMAGVNISLGSI